MRGLLKAWGTFNRVKQEKRVELLVKDVFRVQERSVNVCKPKRCSELLQNLTCETSNICNLN